MTLLFAETSAIWLSSADYIVLLVSFVLPLWVVSGENSLYESRLPIYHKWLGTASVIHLATIAVWVLIGERTVKRDSD